MAIGDLVGGAIDFFGGNNASDIQRKAQRKAGGILDQGYGNAINLAQPMQEQSQKDYTNLSNNYAAGDFKNPTSTPYDAGKFSFDPNSVFQDPEYKAQLKAGTNAIDSSAAGKGMLFSGNTANALQGKAADIFANRSDDLYNRAYGQFTGNRDFGAQQQQQSYLNNANNNATAFNQGNTLAGYAPDALDTSLNLNLGRAQAGADTELGVGATRANAYNLAGKKLGQGVGSYLNSGEDALAKYGPMLLGA
jgi:hypothetical protein